MLTPSDNTAPARGVLVPFLIVALIWGSTWLVIKDQIAAVPPGWTVTWRFTVAGIGMALLARVRGESLRLPPGGQKIALLMGLTQFCGNFQFVYRAEHYLTSGIVAVFFALLLVPNTLFSRLFLKTPVSGRFLAGSAVAIAGIAVLLLHEYRLAPPQASVLAGVAFCFAGLLCASAANVLQATEAARRCQVVPLLVWAMAWGVLVDAALSWWLHGAPVFDPRPQYLLGIAYLGIIGSVLTFPLYFMLIGRMGAGGAAYNGVLVPVIAMGLSTLFEGYRWTPLAALGSALAVAGLLIALSRKQATSPSR